jgi:hypothetical protein
MKAMVGGTLLVAASVVVAGCPAQEEVDVGVAADGGADRADRGDSSDPAHVPVCLRGERFVADGVVQARDREPGDAARIGAVRWAPYEGCERVVLDLAGDDGAAADRAGRVTAEVLRGLGVVRVSLRDVAAVESDATDTTFDGPLATAAYVVRSPEGAWLYVDVHLGDAAEAYVATLDAPARVVVDLRPGGPAVPDAAPRATRVVVLEPRPGRASYPLTVTGYARTFEANVVVRLEQDGRDVYDDFTTSTGYVDAWGHYTFTIDQGPRGPVVLHVGEHSARDGSWEGVAVELNMR